MATPEQIADLTSQANTLFANDRIDFSQVQESERTIIEQRVLAYLVRQGRDFLQWMNSAKITLVPYSGPLQENEMFLRYKLCETNKGNDVALDGIYQKEDGSMVIRQLPIELLPSDDSFDK